VTNLIVNGLTHGKATAQEPISVNLRSDGRFVSIQVADHGPGIDSREIKKVFDRFSRGRKSAAAGIPGLGLGLALVREFAISCGGKVTLVSEPGQGSVFTMYLPKSGDC
jgi:signal transduction histidine kinase